MVNPFIKKVFITNSVLIILKIEKKDTFIITKSTLMLLYKGFVSKRNQIHLYILVEKINYILDLILIKKQTF